MARIPPEPHSQRWLREAAGAAAPSLWLPCVILPHSPDSVATPSSPMPRWLLS